MIINYLTGPITLAKDNGRPYSLINEPRHFVLKLILTDGDTLNKAMINRP